MRAGRLVRAYKRELKEDRLGDLAAMMTYFALFALFPMAVFVITVALLVVPPEALAEATSLATRAMPEEAGAMIEAQVKRMQETAGGGLALGSLLLAMWGASRGAVSLGRVLNEVFGLEETRPWWKRQAIGIGVTLGVAVLLVAALGLLVAGPAVGHWLTDRFGLGAVFDTVWTLGRWVGAALLVMVIWALLYKLLPDTDAPLRVFTPGAIAGVLFWIGISLLFALYVRNFGNYDKTYGALGAVMVFLTWLWLSNLAMLAGAELDDVVRRGSDDAIRRGNGRGGDEKEKQS
ncbi:MAG TPA: YihY/virulence factor BrkB family protein [Kofleriaceae bacterium]|nr:YihY/virulence factor BrkB family protein [Kofleriaceae bacterium]